MTTAVDPPAPAGRSPGPKGAPFVGSLFEMRTDHGLRMVVEAR